MKKLLRKLNGRRGASLTLAILIFMLCALAGASALIMASANAGRYSHAQDDRQTYYSVTSAALLTMDLLEGLKYESPRIEREYIHRWVYNSETQGRDMVDEYTLNILTDTRDATDGHLKLNESKFDPYIHTKDDKGKDVDIYRMEIPRRSGETSGDTATRHALENGNLVRAILLQCDKIVPYLSVPREWYSSVDKETAADGSAKTTPESFRPADLSYSFTIAPTDNSFGAVKARLVMSANYDLLFSFTGGDASASTYAINLYWEATVTETAEKGEPQYAYTDSGETASITITDSKYVKISWEKKNVTISRGEAMEV